MIGELEGKNRNMGFSRNDNGGPLSAETALKPMQVVLQELQAFAVFRMKV